MHLTDSTTAWAYRLFQVLAGIESQVDRFLTGDVNELENLLEFDIIIPMESKHYVVLSMITQ